MLTKLLVLKGKVFYFKKLYIFFIMGKNSRSEKILPSVHMNMYVLVNVFSMNGTGSSGLSPTYGWKITSLGEHFSEVRQDSDRAIVYVPSWHSCWNWRKRWNPQWVLMAAGLEPACLDNTNSKSTIVTVGLRGLGHFNIVCLCLMKSWSETSINKTLCAYQSMTFKRSPGSSKCMAIFILIVLL